MCVCTLYAGCVREHPSNKATYLSCIHLTLDDNAGITKPIKAEAVGKKQTRFNNSMSVLSVLIDICDKNTLNCK